jgi:hypothetical protein
MRGVGPLVTRRANLLQDRQDAELAITHETEPSCAVMFDSCRLAWCSRRTRHHITAFTAVHDCTDRAWPAATKRLHQHRTWIGHSLQQTYYLTMTTRQITGVGTCRITMHRHRVDLQLDVANDCLCAMVNLAAMTRRERWPMWNMIRR